MNKRTIYRRCLHIISMLCITIVLVSCGYVSDAVQEEHTATLESPEQPTTTEVPREERIIAETPVYSHMDYDFYLRENGDQTEVWAVKDEKEWLLKADYDNPEDLVIEPFEDVMGHNGIRLHWAFEQGRTLYFCTMDYYGLEEKPIHLAYYWGGHGDTCGDNAYLADLDNDGIEEMICNVQWLADGAEDVEIYQWDGEKVYNYAGTDFIVFDEEEDVSNIPSLSYWSNYLPESNTIATRYWSEEKQEHITKEYAIDLSKVNKYEFH